MQTMRQIAMVSACVFLLLSGVATAGDMRCGNSFIKVGERAYLVLQKCGEPIAKQEVGYTVKADQQRELVIEEWIYGPRDGGYYYIITFVGGRVSEITSERL